MYLLSSGITAEHAERVERLQRNNLYADRLVSSLSVHSVVPAMDLFTPLPPEQQLRGDKRNTFAKCICKETKR